MGVKLQKNRMIVMLKLPAPGYAKTRLIPHLGERGAADLALKLLHHTLLLISHLKIDSVELWMSPAPSDPRWMDIIDLSHFGEQRISCHDQGQGDLGVRLERAARKGIDEGFNVSIIGTDCPFLNEQDLLESFERLLDKDVCIYPSFDGGYVLIGMRKFSPFIFSGIPWSTSAVTTETLDRIEHIGWTYSVGQTFQDIDEHPDLESLKKFGSKFNTSL